MMLCRNCYTLVTIAAILLASLFLVVGTSHAAAKKNDVSFSPVNELGPSLAASVAGGTVIAVRSSVGRKQDADSCDNDESVVLLFRSPNDSSNRGDAGSNLTIASIFGSVDNNNNLDYQSSGLAFLPNGPATQPFLSNRNNNLRILHANSGLVMAATGLKSDADHLLNVAAGRVLSRISVYDAPSSSSLTIGKSVDPHRLIRDDVSPLLIDAAMSDGGRPWGVQLLVVGQSTLCRDQLLDIYTVDPTGVFRHRHGAVAAIGRGAERIISLSSLTKEDLTTESRGWRHALDVAMTASINSFEQNQDTSSNIDELLTSPTDVYTAVVIFGKCDGSRASRCASVCPDVIAKCYRRIISPERRDKEITV